MAQRHTTVFINKEYPLVGDFMTSFKGKVGLDLSFNRLGCWDPIQRSKYMTSLILGQAPSKIVVANIEECLSLCIEGTLDYEYFKRWQELGYEYIAIDGNNRTQTIDLYLKGEVAIEPGIYVLPIGSVSIHSTNNTFKTHPKILKDYIREHIMISICEYTVATRAGLSQLFININDGVTLKPQEYRNAKLVPFADAVRNTVIENETAFRFSFKDNSRLVIDEQIVLLSVYATFGAEHGVSKKDKDMAYDDNSAVWINFSTQGGEKKILETLKLIDKFGTKGFKNPSSILNLFMVINELYNQKRKIVDKQAFMKWFLSTEAKRLGDPEILVVKKQNGEHRNYFSCCMATSAETLPARFKEIRKDMGLLNSKIVTELDPDRLFTAHQRYQMWKKQNGKCSQTGKNIPEEQINDHTLWQADHVYPWTLGGETTLENGELVCAKYNLSKKDKVINKENNLIAA